MTREEAIAYGKECLLWNKFSREHAMYQFIEMAIQALSQEPICDRDCEHCTWTECPIEPCDDAISRKDIQDYIAKYLSQYLYEDVRQAVEVIDAYIGDMPSVTQKSGKWIKTQSGNEDFPESIVCSRCKNENSHLDFNEHSEPIGKIFVTSKYCPNCGARMVEPQESGDKE